MDLVGGYRPDNKIKMEFGSGAVVIIKVPVLRIMSQLFFLAVVFQTLPSIGSIIRGSSSSNIVHGSGTHLDFQSLSWFVRDLYEEGQLEDGYKGLIVSSDSVISIQDLKFLSDNNDFYTVIKSDLEGQNSFKDEIFDVVVTSSCGGSENFIDRVVKINGIVITQITNHSSSLNEFTLKRNYKIVYIRQFDSTVVAMRKTGLVNPPINRRLCGFTPEAKKAALKSLENLLLEPARRGLTKSINQLKKIRFLADLLGDSLGSYRRKIFITDDEKLSGVEWFYENYPTTSQRFEVYNVGIERYGGLGDGLLDWLKKNVREEEDYVMMKAGAEVVGEMVKEKAICLVDELFLECSNQWEDGGVEKKTKMAYWQCLALYERLRDEGVAVHQWWG